MICVTQHDRVKPQAVRADVFQVGPELTAAPRTNGCPSCGASVRPDAQWCGQCYADFRPQPAAKPVVLSVPPSAPAASAAYGLPAADPLTQPLVDFLPPAPTPTPASASAPEAPHVPHVPQPVVEATWPCAACHTANPLSAMVCTACGQGFLSGVHDADQTRLVLPVVGDLAGMSRGRRLGLALALVAGLLVPLALLTLLLTERPEDGSTDPATDTSVTTTVP